MQMNWHALFKSDGELFDNGDVKIQTMACHACHKLVPERNFVFSERIEVSPFVKKLENTYELSKNSSHLRFVEYQPASDRLRKYLKKTKIKSLKIVDGDLRKYFFSGTLDEITPLLINQLLKESVVTKHTIGVGFVSEDESTYKIVSIETKSHPKSHLKRRCGENEVGLQLKEYRRMDESSMKEFDDLICHPKK